MSTPSRTHRIALALTLAAAFLIFAQSLRYQFVYDDLVQIVRNPNVQTWTAVPRYFTEHVWAHLGPERSSNYYRPVFLLWLLLNHTLFGLKPAGWHLTNLLLHVLATWLVYLFANRFLRDRAAAVAAAFLFALNPLHVEAVAWISGSTETLVTIFVLGAFLLYQRFRDEGRGRTALYGSLLLYALAALTKETGVVLFLLVAAYEGIFRDEEKHGLAWIGAAFANLLPFLAVTGAYLGVRAAVLHHMMDPDRHGVLPGLLSIPAILWFYIRQLALPIRLSGFYDVHLVEHAGLANFALPLALLLASGIVLAMAARRSREAAFLIAWIFLPLLPPLIGVATFIDGELVHDRYLYLPSAGAAVLMVMGLRALARHEGSLFAAPRAQLATVLLIGCWYATVTVTESAYWANDNLLYRHAVEMAPRNTLAHNHLANELFKQGRYEESIAQYQESLRLESSAWLPRFGIGVANFERGRMDEAVRFLAEVVERQPQNLPAQGYLGMARLKGGQAAQAEAPLRYVVERAPGAVGYHYALGQALMAQGKWAEARQQFQAELKLDPQSPARNGLAEAERHLGPGR